MRKALVTAGILLFLSCINAQAQKSITFQPEKPKQGSSISFTYNPSGTSLFGSEDILAYAYLLYPTQTPVVHEIPLTKSGNQYTGTIKTDDSTLAVFIKFAKPDNYDRDNEGYYFLLYDITGKPVKGAELAAGKMLAFGGYQIGIKRDVKAGAELLRTAFETYPSDQVTYREDYVNYLNTSEVATAKDQIRKIADDLVANPDATERDFNFAKYYYGNALKDKEKAIETEKKLKEKFPTGSWVRTEKVTAAYKETNAAKKDALLRELMDKYPAGNLAEEQQLYFLTSDVADLYAKNQDYAKMNETLEMIKDKNIRASAYNNIAWEMAGSGVDGKPKDLEIAKELSAKSLALMKEVTVDLQKKPSYETEKQWKYQNDDNYYNYADTYAVLLFHNKEYDKAYEVEKEAVASFKRNNVELNRNFCAILEKAKGPGEAQKELEAFIKEGKYSSPMKAQLKKIYLGQKHSEAEWSSYIAALEKEALIKQREELVKQMLSVPAPEFKLKDLNGATVSLSSLKGKTVILDFWATWCGPCIASMPGMQKAVNKYKSDPTVVFLFVDTWEGGDNRSGREKDVKGFITKKNYNFTVLYDEPQKNNTDKFIVVSDYKVDGIPTKFIIDKNNIIRFKAVGYNGNVDAMLSELSIMIELAAKEGTKKAGF